MRPLQVHPDHVLPVASDRFGALAETSDERFDRASFARQAVDLVRPARMTVAICEGSSRMRVESGPIWGRRGETWALVAVSDRASRRAIALAVATLARVPRAYALDALLDSASEPAP
ncbi:MAG TPA: hypothetical protein VKU41_05780 [Polyangiaceae bacterium]|nr:hypothetical protein [Polyangiaceae bacterium]